MQVILNEGEYKDLTFKKKLCDNTINKIHRCFDIEWDNDFNVKRIEIDLEKVIGLLDDARISEAAKHKGVITIKPNSYSYDTTNILVDPDIKSIEKLQLNKDDIIIVRVKSLLSNKTKSEMEQHIKETLGIENKIIVIDDAYGISIIKSFKG